MSDSSTHVVIVSDVQTHLIERNSPSKTEARAADHNTFRHMNNPETCYSFTKVRHHSVSLIQSRFSTHQYFKIHLMLYLYYVYVSQVLFLSVFPSKILFAPRASHKPRSVYFELIHHVTIWRNVITMKILVV